MASFPIANLDESAASVWSEALQWAAREGADDAPTARHLWLALATTDSPATEMLVASGVDMGELEEHLLNMATSRPPEWPAEEVARVALRESEFVGLNYVSCGYLLLAMLRMADPFAAYVKAVSGLTIEDTTIRVRRGLSG